MGGEEELDVEILNSKFKSSDFRIEMEGLERLLALFWRVFGWALVVGSARLTWLLVTRLLSLCGFWDRGGLVEVVEGPACQAVVGLN